MLPDNSGHYEKDKNWWKVPKFKCDNLSDFQTLCYKASSGWALRFCKRHTDYLNPDFSIGAKLPDHLEERASRFRVVLQQLIKEKNFSPPQIGCMDELPLNLSPSLRDKRIGPGILLKHHGLQGAQATVFLTMTANGKLLPPLLVLKVRHPHCSSLRDTFKRTVFYQKSP